MNYNLHSAFSSVFLRGLIFLFPIFITVNLNLVACVSQRLETVTLAVERAGSADVQIKVEIARTDEERNKGLMYRKNLPDGEGMLFVFERDQQLSFWMKNTLIPLSIAYIASDGRIAEIRDMYPHDENPVHSSRSVRYALEVPQGWFGRAGIRPGDVVKIDTIPNTPSR